MYNLIGFILGVLTPFQLSMNAQLNKDISNKLLSTFYIFAIGSTLMIVLTLLFQQSLILPLHIIATQPLWLISGSILGIFFIFGNIITLSKIGITQSSLLPLIGQFTASLLIDSFGLFYIPKQNITLQKIIGILLLIASVTAITLSTQQQVTNTKGKLIYQFLAISLGFSSTIQAVINSRLSILLYSPIKAGLYNFLIPTVIIFIILLIKRTPLLLSKTLIIQSPKWMWLGSFIGPLFVSGAAFITPIIGANLFVMTTLLGIVSGSVLIAHFGLLRNTKKTVSFLQIAYVLLAFIGVFLQLF